MTRGDQVTQFIIIYKPSVSFSKSHHFYSGLINFTNTRGKEKHPREPLEA